MKPLTASIVVLAWIAGAACVSYPGLPAATDGAGTGGGSATGGSSTAGGGGSTNPSGPTDTPDAETPSVEGRVDAKLCDRVIAVAWDDPKETIVYYGAGSNYQSWNVGDPVALDEEGNLVNLKNRLRVQSSPLGEVAAETFLRQTSQITLTATLQNGSFWLFTATDYSREVSQWINNGDRITVVRDGGVTYLINLRRCTATRATEP